VAVALQYEPGQTALDADELAQLIPRHIATQGQLNEWEQANIVEALKWLKRGRHPAVLTEKFCRELHKRMFGKTWKWAGTFRQSDKNIGCDWRQVPTRLRQLLDNAEFWVRRGCSHWTRSRCAFTISSCSSTPFRTAMAGTHG
jgi:fido (protein-threonine AMPylation protein)